MKKTRVKKGKTYWWIRIYDGIEVCADMDWHKDFSTKNFNDGNYFHTKEEAEVAAEKIRKVLKGADIYTQEEITKIKANAFADGMEAEQRKSKIVK